MTSVTICAKFPTYTDLSGDLQGKCMREKEREKGGGRERERKRKSARAREKESEGG